MTGASKATTLRIIAYYLNNEALDLHEEQMSTVVDDPEEESYGKSTMCA